MVSLFAMLSGNTTCSSSAGDDPDVPGDNDIENVTGKVHRNVLVYMVADNSLGAYNYDQDDLDEMLIGAQNGDLNGGRLLVYHNRRGTNTGSVPQLLEVTASGIKVLKEYPDDPDIYSVDVDRMREAIADSRRYAPADDYGIVLWSHGDGWKETSSARSDSPILRSFGDDRGQNMKISSLRQALEGQNFSFVYFDCCFMATIEVMYELRNVTPVIAGSGIELPNAGMPYHLNLSSFFANGKANILQAAKNTFEYYDAMSDFNRTCAMTVVNTAAIDELASATRRIFATVTDYSQDLNTLQRYERPGWIPSLYDFRQYIEMICTDQALLSSWQKAFDNTVVYAAHTPTIFYELYLDHYCGLGSYVIMSPSDVTFRNYNLRPWFTDVVSASPLYD
ncbi:MAG: clostripain-related cysteine peptidase [Lachnoclostridium sp.]|nr:clostripain-related cysteine peptidase [Lachnoclostridium sp.]